MRRPEEYRIMLRVFWRGKFWQWKPYKIKHEFRVGWLCFQLHARLDMSKTHDGGKEDGQK